MRCCSKARPQRTRCSQRRRRGSCCASTSRSVRPSSGSWRRGPERRSSSRAVEAVDTELRALLPEGLPDGSYLLSYRVTSADGHPIVGSFVFAIGAPSARASPPLAAAGQHRRLLARSRGGRSGALVRQPAARLGPGAVPRSAAGPDRSSAAASTRPSPGSPRSASPACLAMLGATGGALYGGPAGALLSPEPWRIALASPVATSVALAAPGPRHPGPRGAPGASATSGSSCWPARFWLPASFAALGSCRDRRTGLDHAAGADAPCPVRRLLGRRVRAAARRAAAPAARSRPWS